MSGPIIRSRASRSYAQNWSAAFAAGTPAQKTPAAKSRSAKSKASAKKSKSSKKSGRK